MASSSSRPERIKRTTIRPTSRPVDIDGWISDDEKQVNFIWNWRDHNLVNPKYIDISFFRNNRFQFQEQFVYQSLEKFVQLQGIYYSDLIKVFYANAREENSTMVSRVKGITITLDDFIWTLLRGFN